MRLFAVVVSLLVAAGSAHAQPPRPEGPRERPAPGEAARETPRGTSTLRGTVIAADSGAPIRRAQVRISGLRVASRLATTDAQGRYEVRDLPAGRYTVSASKGGFVALQYGQKRPSESGTPLELGDGQVLDKLVIALPRGSVISGRITDEFGEPVANASVSVMRYGYGAGGRRLLPGSGPNSRDTTDDQGHYRLFGLSPGDYIVTASFRSGGEAMDPAGENTGYAATYYPGTTNVAEAQRVTVALGQEQGNVIFSLISTRLVRVSGTTVNSLGAPLDGGSVVLVPAGGRIPLQAAGTSHNSPVDRTGKFRVLNVPPGRYTAQVRSGRRGPNNGAAVLEAGRHEITVGAQDLEGIVLTTAPGARITGTVVSDRGSTATLRPQDITIGTRTPEGDGLLATPNVAARVGADWTFEINNVFDPRLFRVSTPDGWMLKSITLNGQDVSDAPIDIAPGQTVTGVQIVLTDRVTEVNGRLADGRNNPVTDATIVIFPAAEEKWMVQSRFIRGVRPDQDGRFMIRGLPAYDDYLAVAVQGLEEGQAGDPEFLASIRDRATPLSLREGEARTLDMRLP